MAMMRVSVSAFSAASLFLLPVTAFHPLTAATSQARRLSFVEPWQFINVDASSVESPQRPVLRPDSPDTSSNGSDKLTSGNLPPVMQHIADERREFQMNLGRAMDVLRRDMPDILVRTPDYSIFDDRISLVDPSGVQLTGLDKYKSAFAFFQTFVRFWFSSRSGLQYRMVYDFCRSSIRISWNAVLIPKVPLGRPLYVDGISYYQLDRTSGKIIEHRIEKLLINNAPVAPPYGMLSLLQQDVLGMRPHGVPVGVGVCAGL